MNAKFKLKLKRDVPILIAGGVVVLVCLLQILPGSYPQFDLFQRLEWISYDWRVRLAAKRPQPFATNLLAGVYITDRDLKEMNDGSYGYREKFPWPIHYYGNVVRELGRQEAMVIGFDILFELLNPNIVAELPDGTKMPADQFFAQQLRNASNVVLAAEAEGNVFPADLFQTNGVELGNIFTQKDPDAILRRVKAYSEYRVWHSEIKHRERALNLDLALARFETGRIVVPRTDGETPYEIPLNGDGSLRMEELTGEKSQTPQWPATTERIWNLGIVLAARVMGLDLNSAAIEPHRITLRGAGGIERVIPDDPEGFFYVDWSLRFNDPRVCSTNIIQLIRADYWRAKGDTNAASPFHGKLVVIGSTGTGGNIADLGATPLEKETPLVIKHLNVANAIIMNRFIRKSSDATELLLILLLGAASALTTWKLRTLQASFLVVMAVISYVALGAFLFVQYRYWLPLIMPPFAAVLMNLCMVTHRVIVERTERQRIKSVFSKIVSPNVVNELLNREKISLSGARRMVTVYFADIRGFTRVTDENQAKAEEYVRTHKLPPAVAEAYLDGQAREVLTTVNLYLSVIADKVKEHNGTLDKYIGDCVMAFWGSPTPNERHAVDCVRAAIGAQCAIYDLNLQRAAENTRRERENEVRSTTGQPALPMLTLLALGSGINTGDVTVGLMGSDAHILNYTVFGREVNLASRLEGVSGRGRVIISDTTYKELKRFDPELAATCVELPPEQLKGFRDAVQIYEVKWREIDTEMQSYDTAILTGRRATPPTDMIPPGEE